MPTSDHLVSTPVFMGFVTAMTFALALWAFYDLVKWRRLRGSDPADPLVKDKKFGYVMGLTLGVAAVLGALMYQGVF